MVLVLSHGQAQVERGFSVNEDMLLPNMRMETLVALKTVYDTIHSQKIKVAEFQITDRLLQYCKGARAKYEMYHLDKQKANEVAGQKRKSSAVEEG